MSTTVLVPLEEYLTTSYRPDCDYLEGELLERNVGEYEHSWLQGMLTYYLISRAKDWGILVLPEQRVQVKPRRFRVPDITVLTGPRPSGGIITEPPFLCIELLSPEDRMQQMQQRVDDYLEFGVKYVWAIDPRTLHAFVYTAEGVRQVKDGVLSTEEPRISVALSQLE